ncbi:MULTISPECIES: hypothetical protein [unclassified Diaminobutyricimonas]|uniref:hypothetical protein n=1 Tax=unclassified Diaminobutyricimonas TaxID=2643261 RepID=UPI0012F479B7|nr:MULTISPECIES: hypothetical protein [unclassified Diaminobutyricimonas]
MGFFRRRRSVNVGKYVAPEEMPPPPVDRVVDEGVLIAITAVRMHVKNEIIVRAIKNDADYNVAELAEVARDEFEEVAKQNDGYAAGPVSVRHIEVYSAMAAELRKAAQDPELIAATVEQAREDAWREISGVVASRLEKQTFDPSKDPRYEKERAARMRALIKVDLATLKEESRDSY